jgi:glycosyltransferase involved in cell wall biosynthesis
MKSRGWKVLHQQILEIGKLELEPEFQGIYVCLWHHGMPLGHLEFLAGELPLSEIQVRYLATSAIAPAVEAHLALAGIAGKITETPLELLTELWRNGNPAPSEQISLVICTRKRPAHLERCLRSVQAQSRRPDEVIVIDNSDGDAETRRVVSSLEGVRLIVENRTGLSRARNTGVLNSSFPLIAFTDDDIVLSPDWLKQLTGAFTDPKVSAASGLVLPAELRTQAQLLFEKDFGGFNQGYEPRLYGPDFIKRYGRWAPPVWSISTGGNMAIRRRTLDQFGLFDERLGAGAAGCSEDSEYWYRILAGGGVCAYVPGAAVHHYHREDLESLRRQIYFYMRGHVAALFAQFSRSGQWSNLHRVFIELPGDYAEQLVRWLMDGDENKRVLLTGARGCAAGIWYWLLHGYTRSPGKTRI